MFEIALAVLVFSIACICIVSLLYMNAVSNEENQKLKKQLSELEMRLNGSK